MDGAEVEARICRILRDFEGVVSLYLFGSFAEGREHGESDVDVGILLDREYYPDEKQRFDQRLLLSAALSLFHGPKADVVILNDAPATLGRAVVTRGKRLVCRDKEKDHAFVRDIQLQAADLDLFLRRMRAIKIHALERR